MPWGKERETLLLEDTGEQVIAQLQHFLELRPALAPLIHSLRHNAVRMCSTTYRQRGYVIGSGAIESAGTSGLVHIVRSSARMRYHEEQKIARRTQEVARLCPS